MEYLTRRGRRCRPISRRRNCYDQWMVQRKGASCSVIDRNQTCVIVGNPEWSGRRERYAPGVDQVRIRNLSVRVQIGYKVVLKINVFSMLCFQCGAAQQNKNGKGNEQVESLTHKSSPTA